MSILCTTEVAVQVLAEYFDSLSRLKTRNGYIGALKVLSCIHLLGIVRIQRLHYAVFLLRVIIKVRAMIF